jgi:hypothetical protein
MLLPVRVDLSMGADANGFCARLQGGPNSRQRQLFRFTSMRQSFPFVLLLSPLESSAIACLKDNRSHHAVTG